MSQQEKQLSEKESLDLIAQMISKAKDSYHSTGIGAMMWGAVVAICSIVRLSEIQFGYRLPFDIHWLTIAAIIPQIFLTMKEKKERKVKSYDDTYMDYLWLGFGICILLMIFILNAIFFALEPLAADYRSLGGHSSFSLREFIAPLFLLLYGLPTFVTGAACKFRPMLWGGILCWSCCIAAIFTTVKIDLMLTALSAIAAWLIPGLIMEKEYRLHKKEQTALDV